MGIEINKPLNAVGVNYSFLPNRVRFAANPQADSFEYTTVDKYTSENALQQMITNNPQVSKIMREINSPVVLNMKDLQLLLANHTKNTQNIAAGISENLPFALNQKVNLKSLKDAAYLHDLGKVLIPEQILNKQGKLDAKETEIMHRHSELGYELLKTTDIDTYTLELIKNHHQNALGNGYPQADAGFKADINLQILYAADKYSALTEARPYKEAFEQKQALTIIFNDVKEGKLNPIIFRSLVNWVNSQKPVSAAV